MKRRLPRIGLFLAVSVPALVYLSLQYSPQQLVNAGRHKTAAPTYPETYSEGVTNRQFNRQGQVAQILRAERIDYHGEGSDTHNRIEKPDLTLFSEGEQAPWRITAQSAIGGPRNDVLTLQKQVLARTRHPQRGPVRISTDRLNLATSTKRAHTDKPVTIRSARGTTRAVGLEADMNIGRITLLSEVKGIYEPR